MQHLHYAQMDSTNSAAERFALANPGQVALISADVQTAGRGRTGRTWQSPRGGAWFTLVWPCTQDVEHYETAPLLTGLAVAEAVEQCTPAMGIQIKWPNDLLLAGNKLCGILCQRTLAASKRNQGGALLIGVGINVNNRVPSLGDKLRHPPTSLLDQLDEPSDLRAVIRACGQRIAQAMAQLERVGFTADDRAAITQRLAWRGQPVAYHCAGHSRVAALVGIDPAGRLQLQEENGDLRAHHAGEIAKLSLHPTVLLTPR